MAKNVDLQERLNMRFLTVAYKEKQEAYGTCCDSADTGNIALDVLNIPDAVLEDLLELTEPMMDLVDYLNKHRNPDNKTLGRMMTASKNIFRVVDLLREVPPFAGQDFSWLDENLPKVFAPEKVTKAYTERKKEQGELFIQAITRFLAGVLLLGCLLFLPAGTRNYPQGKLLMGILFVPMFLAGLVMLKKNPELLKFLDELFTN